MIKTVLPVSVAIYIRICLAIEVLHKKQVLFNFTILPTRRFISQGDPDPTASVVDGMIFFGSGSDSLYAFGSYTNFS
jgi:hypothetical protein